MSKFTKGPWVSTFNGVYYDITSSGKKVADSCASSCTGNLDLGKANAHLIAAAPEMYEMLKACSVILNQVEQWHTAKHIDDLLAKARGES